jgi:primosomal protein N' (replication factor Y)
VSIADTRGILRREPLTPPLSRAIRETLAAKRRVFLVVSRLTSSLACDECGTVVRCAECAIAFAYSRAAARLVCRVCGASHPPPDTCATGVRTPTHALRLGASASSTPCAAGLPTRASRAGTRLGARRPGRRQAAAAAADVVIGTRARSALRPAAPGLAAVVAPDQPCAPDFRAGERTLALAWAAAERSPPTAR